LTLLQNKAYIVVDLGPRIGIVYASALTDHLITQVPASLSRLTSSLRVPASLSPLSVQHIPLSILL